MSVWVTVPSARPLNEVEVWAEQWQDMGYLVAIQRDPSPDVWQVANLVSQRPYLGYAEACNRLIGEILRYVDETQAEWFICAGDDVLPDPNKRAEEIAIECKMHFYNNLASLEGPPQPLRPHGTTMWTETYGVMQPTGDPWADSQGRIIERIAGSAWYGREYCRRVYDGTCGPLWPEYYHCFVDEEAQLKAQGLGVFWQRPDLVQLHNNWARPRPGERAGQADRMPDFLKTANSGTHWNVSKRLFEARRAMGFPSVPV